MHKLENEDSDWSERGNKTSTVHFLIKKLFKSFQQTVKL